TLLLAAMGLLSLLLRNQLFFRLKPAVIEGLMAIAIVMLLFLPRETLKNYLGHQVKGLILDEGALPALRRSLVMMIVVLAVHVALTLWAAFAASTALWGFVSGGLLYIMLGMAFLGQWISARKIRKATPKIGSQPGEAFSWSLLICDDMGRILAEKSSTDARFWDNPARGRASGETALETKLGQSLAMLGIGAQAVGTDADTVHVKPITIQPAFIIESSGAINGIPTASASAALGEILVQLKPASTLVLAAMAGSSAFPKGVDPTERRLWTLSDLEALAAQDRLSPAFAREIRVVASLRRPLPMAEEPSIVTDTNDALI
ncbi:MAG: hypothetical protein Q8O15_08275, partial [Rectinemataceae bacterium]|nr:hypothetical protein [Rectinemataceae bacterium]